MEALLLRETWQMPKAKKQTSERQPAPNFIREWRKHRRLTLEQLEERCGLGASTISQIERRVSGYSWESLEDIAEALNCTTADMLSGPPDAPDATFLAEVRQLSPDQRPRALEMIRLLGPAPFTIRTEDPDNPEDGILNIGSEDRSTPHSAAHAPHNSKSTPRKMRN